MKALTLAVVYFAVSCSGAFAQIQVPEPFRGNWKVKWKQPAAGFVKDMEAKLVLNDSGGTWSVVGYFPNSNHYPCDRLKAAVTLVSASTDEIIVKLNTSAAINGCTDGTLPLKRIDEKRIGGKLGDADLVFARD